MDDVQRSRVSQAAGIAGFPLWALSYAWVPFRAMDPEPGWVWPAVVVGEVGAVVVGIAAVAFGVAARRRSGDADVRARAGRGLALGVTVLALVVGLNLLYALFVA